MCAIVCWKRRKRREIQFKRRDIVFNWSKKRKNRKGKKRSKDLNLKKLKKKFTKKNSKWNYWFCACSVRWSQVFIIFFSLFDLSIFALYYYHSTLNWIIWIVCVHKRKRLRIFQRYLFLYRANPFSFHILAIGFEIRETEWKT